MTGVPLAVVVLPLDVAEQVLLTALATHITPRRKNAVAVELLNVLGPRAAFPSLTDAALHRMLWIDLDALCNAGDTQLLGRLFDRTLPNPVSCIRPLRHSPFVLARASGCGHLDVLGYWLTLAADRPALALTPAMARHAISAAVRAHQDAVVIWWFDALPRVPLTPAQSQACRDLALEAATSHRMLAHLLPQGPSPDYEMRCRAIRRAHQEHNSAVVDWWIAHTPQLAPLRFLLPRIMSWYASHLRDVLAYFHLNELGVFTVSEGGNLCQRLCWRQYGAVAHVLFADRTAWKVYRGDGWHTLTTKLTCPDCLAIVTPGVAACPVPECQCDHCPKCALPDGELAKYTATHRSLVAMCKHGHAEGVRAWLRSRNPTLAIPPYALHVASKRRHLGVLQVWLEEKSTGDPWPPLWDGVGLDVLNWLLEHDTQRKWLRAMSLDVASRAGQTHVLDWWLARFREGTVPSLRYSHAALHFKSVASGVKSVRWWVRSGLLDDLGETLGVPNAVDGWRYVCLRQWEVVGMLVAGGVRVSLDPRGSSPAMALDEAEVRHAFGQWWANAMGCREIMDSPCEITKLEWTRVLCHP